MQPSTNRQATRHSTVDAIIRNLAALASREDWRAIDLYGHFYLDYTGFGPAQMGENRRFCLLQALFFHRTGNPGHRLLDTEMGQVLGWPLAASIQISAAALGIGCRREESPDHLRGKIKAALGL